MLSRQILVRVILVALAAAALMGVAAVFAPSTAVGQMVLSALVVVGAAAALLPVGGSGSTERVGAVQVVWTGYVLVLAALALVYVWTKGTMGAIPIGTMTLSWGGMGLVAFLLAMRALKAWSERPWPLQHRIALYGAVFGFGVGMPAVVMLEALPVQQLAVELYWAVIVGSGLAAMNANGLRPSRWHSPRRLDRIIAMAGMAATVLGVIAWVAQSLHRLGPRISGGFAVAEAMPDPALLTFGVAMGAAATAAALWSVMRPLGLAGAMGWLAPTASALTLGLGMVLTMATVDRLRYAAGEDLLWRIGAAVAILDASVLLAAAVAIRIRGSVRGTDAYTSPVEAMAAKCPRCRSAMHLVPGENHCRHCGLAILIGFRDDRCPQCEYDLRSSNAAGCAECGRVRQASAVALLASGAEAGAVDSAA